MLLKLQKVSIPDTQFFLNSSFPSKNISDMKDESSMIYGTRLRGSDRMAALEECCYESSEC